MKSNNFQILVAPRISEKSVKMEAQNKFVFVVDSGSNKVEIKKALESFYDIKIDSINVVVNLGKSRVFSGRKGKTQGLKKAIVTLKKDSKKPVFTTQQ